MTTATKRTNVTLDAAVFAEAKELGLNVSKAAEAGLRAAIKKEQERRWLEENREAIESANKQIEREGLPLEKYRLF